MKFNSQFYVLTCVISFLPFLLFSQISPNIPTLQYSDNVCYAKYAVPDKFEMEEQKVLVKAATEREELIPAIYENFEERILLTPSHTKKIIVPAVFDYVDEKVLVNPAFTKTIDVPAVYKTVTEKVVVKEASTKIIPVPATYETITERVEVSPETRKKVLLPAEYESKPESVVVANAYEVKMPVPAKFSVVEESYEVAAAYEKVENLVPAIKYETEKVLQKPASSQWVKQTSNPNCLSTDPKDCDIWCFVEIPAQYQIVTKEINLGCDGSGVANSGCIKKTMMPAQMGVRTKTVVEQQATYKTEMVPPQYNSIVRTVLKTAASSKEEVIPAVYKTVSKQVLKAPATYREEEIPAEYKDIAKEVMVSPATVKEVEVPAVYETIKKKVVVIPEKVNVEVVSAVYQTIVSKKIVAPERVKTSPVPAVYETVYKKRKVKSAEFKFKRVICDSDVTEGLIVQIQEALIAKGFNPGPIDNIFGKKSKAALVQFQNNNGLLAGHLDFDTVNKLGIDHKPSVIMSAEEPKYAEPQEPWTCGVGMEKDDIAVDVMTPKGGEGTKELEINNNANTNDSSQDNEAGKINGASADEMAMIDEINELRANPKGYIKHIEDYIQKLENDDLNKAYNDEEIRTARELIIELNNTAPMSILKPHDGLYKTGGIHGNDLKSRGTVDHVGSDGSWPWDRVRKNTNLSDGNENLVGGPDNVKESVILLLVDSGIPNRGHRKTLLNPKWEYVACKKVGTVGQMPNTWVQMFGTK